MKQDGSIALFRYWHGLRAGRPAPMRTEIEPADIKKLLADTFILESDARGEAVFRLAGTRLCAIYGRELKGFSFSSLWREKDRTLVARLANGVFRQKSVVVIDFEGASSSERKTTFEVLLLPLDGAGESQRSLGILSPVEKPFWLGANPVIEARIGSIRVVDPDKEPLFLANRPAIAVPDLAPARLGAIGDMTDVSRPGRRIRHLVVLEGGRGD